MKRNLLFDECVASVPSDVRAEVSLNMDIANRITDLLKEKNMTQRDLAKRMDKRESEVSRWLGGSHGFTVSTLAKIEAALGEPIIEVCKPYDGSFVFYPIKHYEILSDARDGAYNNTRSSFFQMPYLN